MFGKKILSLNNTPSIPKMMQLLLFEKSTNFKFEQIHIDSTNIYGTKQMSVD